MESAYNAALKTYISVSFTGKVRETSVPMSGVEVMERV